MNPQFLNVGNAGDVIKHTSLVSIFLSIKKRTEKLLYAETHSFYPISSLGPKGWQKKEANMHSTEAFELYSDLELSLISEKPGYYLCSVALAKTLVTNYSINADWILCERDKEARQELAKFLPAATILNSNANLKKIIPNHKYDTVICLIDPFGLDYKDDENPPTRKLISGWTDSLANSVRANGNIILLVFHYGTDPNWPILTPLGKPAATITKEVAKDIYNLAVYLSSSAAFVLPSLFELGWIKY